MSNSDFLPARRSTTFLANLDVAPTASPIGRLNDYFRRKNTEGRRQLVAALRGLVDEMDALNLSVVRYQDSLAALRNLDGLRRIAELKVLKQLEREEFQLLQSIEINEMRVLADKFEAETNMHEAELNMLEAKERLHRKKHPAPPTRHEAQDPNIEAIRAALRGGGKYTQSAKDLVDELIRERGGEDNLTPEDRERIQNAFHVAAKSDESKG